jgi:hypothetical protein
MVLKILYAKVVTKIAKPQTHSNWHIRKQFTFPNQFSITTTPFLYLKTRVSKNTEIGIHENTEIPIGISVFIGSFQIMKESFDGVSPN